MVTPRVRHMDGATRLSRIVCTWARAARIGVSKGCATLRPRGPSNAVALSTFTAGTHLPREACYRLPWLAHHCTRVAYPSRRTCTYGRAHGAPLLRMARRLAFGSFRAASCSPAACSRTTHVTRPPPRCTCRTHVQCLELTRRSAACSRRLSITSPARVKWARASTSHVAASIRPPSTLTCVRLRMMARALPPFEAARCLPLTPLAPRGT